MTLLCTVNVNILTTTNGGTDMLKEELLKGLSEEQIAKVKACKSQEELLSVAKQEGIELTDEQLAAVSGGFCESSPKIYPCPVCKSKDAVHVIQEAANYTRYECTKCNITFRDDQVD